MVWETGFRSLRDRGHAPQMGKSARSKCPNCGKLNDDVDHLNRCMNNGKQRMLLKCIHELKELMTDNNTFPELMEWIPQYLLKQGKTNFTGLGTMSPTQGFRSGSYMMT